MWAHALTITRDSVELLSTQAGFLLTLAPALILIPSLPVLALLVRTLAIASVGIHHLWADTQRWGAHTSAGMWVNNLIFFALQGPWTLAAT